MEANCHVEPLDKIATQEELNKAHPTILAVWGMGCINCATRVRNGLLRLDGVVSANIDLERGLAYVDYIPSKTNLHALVLAVADSGNDGMHHYRAEIIS